MPNKINRRELLSRTFTAATVAATQSPFFGCASKPSEKPQATATAITSPVAIQRCTSYDPLTFRQALDAAFDSIGGVGDLVRGKTVTIKVNLTGMTWEPVGGLPARETYQTHPNSLSALCAALVEAGAKEIFVVETLYWQDSFENILAESGWDVKAVQSAGHHSVHFEDIRKLLEVLNYLVERENTVVVIEHNLDVIKTADHVIDLGPEGGGKGGYVVATGTPEEIATTEASYTGHFLRKLLPKESFRGDTQGFQVLR